MNVPFATLSTTPTAADVSAWLCQQLAQHLQRLVVRVEAHTHANHTQPINDIAVLGSSIAQLAQWLPVQHATRTALHKLDKLLPALLQVQDGAAQARLLQWLYRLNQQLQPAPATVVASQWLKYKPAAHGSERLVQRLSRWLQLPAIAGADCRASRTALLNHYQTQVFRQLVNHWRSEGITPVALGELLQLLRCLLHLRQQCELLQCFDELAMQLCVMLAYPTLYSDALQLQCWEQLHALVEQGQCRRDTLANCDDIAMLQAVQTDLRRYLPRLQHHLQQAASAPMTLAQDLMTLHYKLPWLLDVAGQRALAQLYQCWYQALALCWKYKQPLPPDLIALLAVTTEALPLQNWNRLSTAQVLGWQLQLLRLWPSPAGPVVQQVALQSMLTPAPLVELTAIPVLLSRSFHTLSSVVPAWFTDADALWPRQQALQDELLLLEKGAAAVRIHEVEIFCSQLLALHQRVAMSVNEFPSALLWRSHQHLLALLDEAAAWQLPQLDLALIADIRRWLQQDRADYHALMVREPASAPSVSAKELLQRLHAFVQALAVLLDQPARFDARADTDMSAPDLAACEQALRPLLLALMLEQAHAADQRREALRPQATIITLTLTASDSSIEAEVTDEGEDSISSEHTAKRLRARLPAHVRQLNCSAVVGVGRRFRFFIESGDGAYARMSRS